MGIIFVKIEISMKSSGTVENATRIKRYS